MNPIEKGKTEPLERLRKRVYPFILRRTKEEVAPDLPEKEETILYTEMGTAQRRIYDRVKKHFQAMYIAALEGGSGQFQIMQIVIEGMLRLRQICLFPGLADRKWEKTESCKLERIREMLPEIAEEGHKILLFSQFTKVLERIRKGNIIQTREFFAIWTAPLETEKQKPQLFKTTRKKKLFLISLKAGGTGLNLTAAEYVFLFDPWWNPAVEAQAIDRAHRIGSGKQGIRL